MPSSRKSDPASSRASNRRLVLNLLRISGPLSRTALAESSGLSAPAVTDLVADLLREGLVLEGERSAGSIGRRPTPIEFNYSGGIVIGVRLKAGEVDLVATDLRTKVLASTSRATADARPESFVDAIVRSLPGLVHVAGRTGTPVIGIGVSLPGIVDLERGLCRRSFRLGWGDVPFARLLAVRAGLPVWLEDDIKAFAIAQQLFGVGRRHRSFAALAIGCGIGSAIVVDGRIYRGARGAAGEFGHITHDPSGPACECGRRGCLTAVHSEPAIVATWTLAAGRADADRADMLAAMASADDTALSVLRRAGEDIGWHLAAFVNVVDPEVIVVGGDAVAFGEALFGPMRDALTRHTLWPAPPLLFEWDESSWVRGAAALAMQGVFDFEQVGAVGSEPDGTDERTPA